MYIYIFTFTWCFCCFYPGVLVEREGRERRTLLSLQNREGKVNTLHVVLVYQIIEKLLTKVDTARRILPLTEGRVRLDPKIHIDSVTA